MKNVVLARIDDRLIHGQVITAWIKTIKAQSILIIDEALSNNIMMPVVALMTCILIGFVVKSKYIEDEIELNAKFKSRTLYRIMIKYICPACMVVILLSSLFLSL